MTVKTLLSPTSGPSSQSAAGRVWSFLLYRAIPILIGLGLAASLLLQPRYTDSVGQPLTARFLHAGTGLDPARALEQLRSRPTRLAESAPAGPVWLLADLPVGTGSADRTSLLLPAHPSVAPDCWLVHGLPDPHGTAAAPSLETLGIRNGLLGQQMRLPNASTASQALCRLNLSLPARLSIEQWPSRELSDTTAHTAHAIGLLEGGLMMMAAFLIIISLTMREHPYTVLACWILCNLRLGAWALGWDHQFLGVIIPPDLLIWLRKLTVLIYYVLTIQFFTTLFQPSLDAATVRRLRLVGRTSAACLLAALLALPHDWFQLTIFLTAWLATALVSVTLIHGLFRFNTRSQLWHTIGVCLALVILLWFLSTYPAPPAGAVGPAIQYSFAGQLGMALAWVLGPIGFNWQIAIALIPGLAAREVAVGALGTVYALSGDETAVSQSLASVIASDWSLATALALLAWYVFAPQCVATLAVVKRETNSWRYPLLMALYLFALAYLAAWITYRVAVTLGAG